MLAKTKTKLFTQKGISIVVQYIANKLQDKQMQSQQIILECYGYLTKEENVKVIDETQMTNKKSNDL